MPELLFVIGLPGSGKTPRLNQLQAEGWKLFDDYKAHAYANDSHFCAARRYCELMRDLQMEQKCVLADIGLCCQRDRDEAIRILNNAFPSIVIRWEYFEKDIDQCTKNIQRSTRSPALRMEKLMEISPQYFPPEGVTLSRIWREDT